MVFFSIAASGFAGPRSAVFVFQSVAITGILALGVTATLVVGGFDLSIGSVATSALMLSAYVMVVMEQSAFVAVVACLAMGALVGLVNGLLIVKMKVPDLLATLGMMFLLVGLQRIPTEGRSISTGHDHARRLDRRGHLLGGLPVAGAAPVRSGAGRPHSGAGRGVPDRRGCWSGCFSN